jgi:hypothetical protein
MNTSKVKSTRILMLGISSYHLQVTTQLNPTIRGSQIEVAIFAGRFES